MSRQSITRPRNWQELSTWKRVSIIAAITVQISLLVAALWDIRHRAPSEIRGSKRLWTAIAFVNNVGPIAYFVLGRRKTA